MKAIAKKVHIICLSCTVQQQQQQVIVSSVSYLWAESQAALEGVVDVSAVPLVRARQIGAQFVIPHRHQEQLQLSKRLQHSIKNDM
jgi:hypothetical protein